MRVAGINGIPRFSGVVIVEDPDPITRRLAFNVVPNDQQPGIRYGDQVVPSPTADALSSVLDNPAGRQILLHLPWTNISRLLQRIVRQSPMGKPAKERSLEFMEAPPLDDPPFTYRAFRSMDGVDPCPEDDPATDIAFVTRQFSFTN